MLSASHILGTKLQHYLLLGDNAQTKNSNGPKLLLGTDGYRLKKV